jgi:SNF2 family DNA or RNA helicase
MSAFLTQATRRVRSWLPHSFQKKGVRLGVSQACVGLLFDPGMGKTTTAYAILTILLKQSLVRCALVIAPLRVVYNVWPRQCREWKEFEHLNVGVLHGPQKENVLAHAEQYDILCINPEGLDWLTGAVHTKGTKLDPVRVKMLREIFDYLIVDESTKFKDSGTQRFHVLRKLIPMFRRRMILTGTIVPNGLLDLFGQIFILDEGAALHPYITRYRNEYFYPSGFGGYTFLPQPDAEVRIIKKIAPLVLRLEAKDYLELPECLDDDRYLEFPDEKVKKIYKAMEDEMMADIADGRIVAANAAVASSKCRQIANGGLYTQAPEWQKIHSVKLDALRDLIEELSGQPLLIAYEFNFDWEMLEKVLHIPRIGISPKKDSMLIQAFRSGALPALMGHPESISLGLDGLQDNCSHICWYGIPWNLLHYKQTIDRVVRQGSKAKRVINHRLIMRGTVDERVLTVLGQKDKTQRDFLELLK